MTSVEQRIADLGLVLPTVKAPAATYANAIRVGDLVYLSGAVPVDANGDIPRGKVGADVTTAEAASTPGSSGSITSRSCVRNSDRLIASAG